MGIRLITIFIFLFFVSSLGAVDTIRVKSIVKPNVFSLSYKTQKDTDCLQTKFSDVDTLMIKSIKLASDTFVIEVHPHIQIEKATDENGIDTALYRNMWKRHESIILDSMAFLNNPLFNELVYMGKSINISSPKTDFQSLYFGTVPRKIFEPVGMFIVEHPLNTIKTLRDEAKNYIMVNDFSLYTTTVEELPKLTWNRYEFIEGTSSDLFIDVKNISLENSVNKDIVRLKKYNPWRGRLLASLQFSQYAVSENWHKGGNNYLAIVGTVGGNLDYDNLKKIKWENTLEWRTGINTVTEDTLNRKVMPSEDLFRLTTKFGLKATGNFYYSTRADLQTQFYDNPKAVNSYELKARLFTPIIFNMGIGMDYRYKTLSVALSPLSFKYTYLSDTARTAIGEYIDPNTFGIARGENERTDWGSELNVLLKDYFPFPELKLNSNLRFFTNYSSVTIDWEIIAEFQINRFLSSRILLNPRYDSSVILEEGKKHKIQMKEMLTIGLSFRVY